MKKPFLAILVLAIVGMSCKNEGRKKEMGTTSEKLEVYVSNYPLFYFAKRIGADKISLHFPASRTGSPSHWKPSSDSIAAMQQADLIFVNGASYEQWLMNVSLPDEKVINTSKKFADRLLKSGESFTHSHGKDGAHEHEGTATTTWLDLSMAVQQAEAIKEALVRKFPEGKATFEGNYEELKNDLLGLHHQFKETITNRATVSIAFSHPVYQYFQEAYGLNGLSFHWEPDVPLTKDQLHELEHLKKEHPVEYIIWEDEPLNENSTLLQKKGVKSKVIYAGSGTPENGDYLGVIEENLKAIREIYDAK